MREELGDVLLQVVLHSQIAKDNNEFNIEDVAKELSDKLIHRHPHVFGDTKVQSTKDIIDNWDKLKKEEKTYRKSILDGVSKSQSALMSAQKISKKVVKVGFEWDSVESLKNVFNLNILNLKKLFYRKTKIKWKTRWVIYFCNRKSRPMA